MRLRDYIALGWDQLRRRKVVTLLCVMGIAIGSASIVVALAFGESISHYSTKQMSYYLKTDEITIMNNSSGSGSGQTSAVDDFGITKQKLNLIKSLPHVKTAASFERIGNLQFVADDTKTGYLDITATDLGTLTDFGFEYQQGAPIDQDNVIVLSYTATVGLRDRQTSLTDAARRQQAQLEQDVIQGREQPPIVPYPLYRKQIRLLKTVNMADGTSRTLEFPVRVVAIEKRAENMSDRAVFFSQKTAYISPGLARQIREAEAAVSGKSPGSLEAESHFDNVTVKVDQAANVAETDKLIQSLKLRTMNNLSRQESMSKEFVIVRIIFGGAGLFILFVASISIIVAMTMSTHQRRRQIGIMKVLGANLGQIRNMFVVESALLGVMGGLAGILFAYWVIWGINVILIKTNSTGSGDAEILFISFWILPLGLFFAMLTGIMSGIFPAIKASRTDALTAIKRE
ncbi:ABC transporter permease [Paenibacillus hemerocallicola]|uniref:ABC transporter permease n=1 Tax=Paenibacillus hemerocallicola TaxID=1172614 RepID=A0A5C4T9D2_9BACL|nr:ABC transporter permease [Paenibacillus hemerocallicola]TNJ65703.1 ABC transporter permease [Paenibacillus hemerocallicola]